jgi:hypothetical protein
MVLFVVGIPEKGNSRDTSLAFERAFTLCFNGLSSDIEYPGTLG